MNEQLTTEPTLRGDVPQAPGPRVPTLEHLCERLKQRRRRRRWLSGAAAVGAVVVFAIGTHALPRQRGTGTTVPPPPQPEVPLAVNANQTDSENRESSLRQRPASDQPRIAAESSNAIGTSPAQADLPSIDPGVRVFARVRDHLPVFAVNEETQLVHQVGWLESERTIPVDMKQLSTSQQQTFKAVLVDRQPPPIRL